MWILAALLQAATPCTPPPTPSEPPALVVQVVDPLCLPLPGAGVRVSSRSSKADSQTHETGARGHAQFWLTAEADYHIEARLVGFKTRRVRDVRAGRPSEPSPTAYVQIRLLLAVHGETVW